MLFNSYIFVLFFLPIVLYLWWSQLFTLHQRLVALVAASYLFYGWWDWRFISLLLLSTVVDFHAGQRLHDAVTSSRRQLWLCVSMFSNLGLLFYFKYTGFFAGSFNAMAEWLRLGGRIPVEEIILPIGISFYAFQSRSYTLDIYRRKEKPAYSFLHFAAYVSLFPQLIAGPIVRYEELEDQLRRIRDKIDWNQFSLGIYFFIGGMIQKILLADTIAAKIDPLFADYVSLQIIGTWYCMLGYSVQLYFDFAGYSNMAVGLGLLLGFSLPQNFDSPYKSANISEFWRRWHMTLSFWLRDYLFIPLGGSRVGKWLTLRNLVIVMFLGGLWHGAGWTFVLWGLLHGVMLVTHNVSRQMIRVRIPRFIAIGITFIGVVFAWALFRSTDMAMAGHLFSSMLGLNGIEPDAITQLGGKSSLAILAILLGIAFLAPNMWQMKFKTTGASAIALSALFVICVMRFDSQSPFLYFQF